MIQMRKDKKRRDLDLQQLRLNQKSMTKLQKNPKVFLLIANN